MTGMDEVLRVLQIEDSEGDAALICRALEQAGRRVQMERVETAEEMLAALERQEWDVVISDHKLPRFDAPSALRTLQETGRDIPFIVVSGTIGELVAVETMRAGAHDYLTKEHLARLGPAVEREVREARMRRDRRREEEERKRLEEQFLQAQKMESIGRLAGGVAHDFNNLLTVILGYSAMVLDQMPPADPLREPMREIHAASERATALVRQLLAFSRKQVFKREALDLNELVAGMENTMLRLMGKHIEVVTRLKPALDWVMADRFQIGQVIMNLVVNARDAMPAGGILTIETEQAWHEGFRGRGAPDAGPGDYVRLTVRDTGSGIDDGIKAHLFEPFFTTKGVGVGTGLGLAVVQGIVLQSGGHVTCESAPAEGAAFHVYLPAVKRAPAPERPSEPAAAGGGETILLVEDEPEVRAFIARALERLGYRILQASNGDEAMAILETGQPDLLLTDMVMAKTSGYELAARAQSLWPRLKMLFISGYSQEIVSRYQGTAAPPAFLQKPFSPQVLARKVREALDGA